MNFLVIFHLKAALAVVAVLAIEEPLLTHDLVRTLICVGAVVGFFINLGYNDHSARGAVLRWFNDRT